MVLHVVAIWVLNSVAGFIGFYLIHPMLLLFLRAIKAKKNQPYPHNTFLPDYGIIVTAFEEVGMIPTAVESLLAMSYDHLQIYIVADNCKPTAALHFSDSRVTVLYPETVLASNVASHRFAIDHFERNHDLILIMDSDNLADADLIQNLNNLFSAGFQAVQGIRLAKNLDTTIARLDAARDIYYHYFDGEVMFDLGSSATLSGSGMAFSASLYKRMLAGINMQGAGFDKVLQAALVSEGYRIAFAKDAQVYDQKTAHTTQLVNQRARWIATWFKYFSYGFKILVLGIAKFNFNQVIFGITLLRPPLFIFLSASVLLIIVNLFISTTVTLLLAGALVIYLISFFIPILKKSTDPRILSALLYIPVFVFYQFISLGKSIFSQKANVATKHNIEDKT